MGLHSHPHHPERGVRLHPHRLDLAAPPEDVLAKIDRLAVHVRRC